MLQRFCFWLDQHLIVKTILLIFVAFPVVYIFLMFSDSPISFNDPILLFVYILFIITVFFILRAVYVEYHNIVLSKKYKIAGKGGLLALATDKQKPIVLGKAFWHKEGGIVSFNPELTMAIRREGKGKRHILPKEYSITVNTFITVGDLKYYFICKAEFSLNDLFKETDLSTICMVAVMRNMQRSEVFYLGMHGLLEQIIINEFDRQKEWLATQIKEKTTKELIESIQKFLFLNKKLIFKNIGLKKFKIEQIVVSTAEEA